jgi:hypothetical protein
MTGDQLELLQCRLQIFDNFLRDHFGCGQVVAVGERIVLEPEDVQASFVAERSRPVAEAMHLWLAEQRTKVPEGSAAIKAIDYSLGRWQALNNVQLSELPSDSIPHHLRLDNFWAPGKVEPYEVHEALKEITSLWHGTMLQPLTTSDSAR